MDEMIMENINYIFQKVNNFSPEDSVAQHFYNCFDECSTGFNYFIGYMADIFMNFEITEELYNKILITFTSDSVYKEYYERMTFLFINKFPTASDFKNFMLLKMVIG